jgi:hypothetical protein
MENLFNKERKIPSTSQQNFTISGNVYKHHDGSQYNNFDLNRNAKVT